MRALPTTLVTVLALGLCAPGALASEVDLGVVTVESDVNGADHDCPADGLPLSCPATWDTNGSIEPGDDAVSTIVFVSEVHVAVHSEAGWVPSEEVSLVPSAIAVQHPVYRKMNETWPTLNESRPDELKPVVGFESRPKKESDPEWGVFVTLYPVGFRNGWCWDICFADNQTYGKFTEDEFRPFPYGVVLREYTGEAGNTDFVVARKVYEVESCGDGMLRWTPVPCDTSAAQPALHDAQTQYEGATPLVVSGFQFNRTTVAIEPEDAAAVRSSHGDGAVSKMRAQRNLPLGKAPEPPAATPEPASWVPTVLPASAESGDNLVEKAGAREPPTVVQGTATPKSPLLVVAAGMTTAVLALVAWLLYHRVSRANGLDQGTRRRVFDALAASPGQGPTELARRLSIGRATVRYHVRRLEEAGLIRKGSGGRLRYFPTDRSAAETRVAEAMAHPTVRAVHAAVVEKREAALSHLATGLGLSVPTVRRAVDRLEAAGLAVSTRVGFRVIVRPTVSTVEAQSSRQIALG